MQWPIDDSYIAPFGIVAFRIVSQESYEYLSSPCGPSRPYPGSKSSNSPKYQTSNGVGVALECQHVVSYRLISASTRVPVSDRCGDRRRVTVMVISSINSKRTFCVTAQQVNEPHNPRQINVPGKLSKYPLGQSEHGLKIGNGNGIGIGSDRR